MPKQTYWTNRSVLALAGNRDPIEEITRRVRELVVRALDAGWTGPPFDPLALADALGIRVRPTDEVPEARLAASGSSACIEYNPNRPRGRMRYSIAHEIAHTLFPDFADAVRYRASHEESKGDAWQLESLCNLAAAEILMPAAQLPTTEPDLPSIESLMALRKQFEVSAEALLRRVVRAHEQPCAMFCASLQSDAPTYQVDYVVPSQSWSRRIPPGSSLPKNSVVQECVAIGFSAKAAERWFNALDVHVECVGVPGYPGTLLPRVVGFISPRDPTSTPPLLQYLAGSALEPRGSGPRIIAHIVNDKTANWGGGGFASRLAKEFPSVQNDFRDWAASHRIALGEVHFATLTPDLRVASMVAQKGYGASEKPRIRYAALSEALEALATDAARDRATLHMPRIGTGQAGGTWEVIEEMVRNALCDQGFRVTVYDLPNAATASAPGKRSVAPKQLSLLG